jgi:hypothetical protein
MCALDGNTSFRGLPFVPWSSESRSVFRKFRFDYLYEAQQLPEFAMALLQVTRGAVVLQEAFLVRAVEDNHFPSGAVLNEGVRRSLSFPGEGYADSASSFPSSFLQGPGDGLAYPSGAFPSNIEAPTTTTTLRVRMVIFASFESQPDTATGRPPVQSFNFIVTDCDSIQAPAAPISAQLLAHSVKHPELPFVVVHQSNSILSQ